MKTRLLLLATMLFLSSMHLNAQCPFKPGGWYNVTNNNDSGYGSLRDVIIQANSDGTGGIIEFMMPFDTILLLDALPTITVDVSIYGQNYDTGNNIVIDGDDFLSLPVFDFTDPSSCFQDIDFVNFQSFNYTVINTNDSGTGSFREGIQQVNSAGSGTIYFNIPGAPPQTINILSELPIIIVNGVSIFGDSQPANGYTGDLPKIILDGAAISSHCIHVEAENFTVRELEIRNFDAGIYTNYANNVLIEDNYVINNNNGIYINRTDNTQVINNTSSGNTLNGVHSFLSSNILFLENRIGTNFTGDVQLGNGDNGMELIDCQTTIGLAGQGNVISGNGISGGTYTAGIFISNGRHEIYGNKIGTNIDGLDTIPNTKGILNNSGVSTLIVGGPDPDEGNIISGNGMGIYLKEFYDSVIIQGNYIGTDITGMNALPNDVLGISFYNYSYGSYILIGGDSPEEGNLISGNDGSALSFQNPSSDTETNVYIKNNIIGLNSQKTGVLPNTNGITGAFWKGEVILESNIVSGNLLNGIKLSYTPYQKTVINNIIGTNESLIADFGNGEHGIQIYKSDSCMIGSTNLQHANIIAFNHGSAISVYTDNSLGHYNFISKNTMYYNNAGITLDDGVEGMGNGGLPAPVITDVSSTEISGTSSPYNWIQLYQNHLGTGEQQGESFLEGTFADSNGLWNATSTFSDPCNVISLAIDTSTLNTSEFSEMYYSDITANAGADTLVCSLTTQLGAFQDTNSVGSWQSSGGVTIDDISNPQSPVTVTVYGTYNLVWCESFLNCSRCDTVNIIFDPCTGISTPKDLFELSVYPNPANTEFFIKYNLLNDKDIEIKLFDGLGKQQILIEKGIRKEGLYENMIQLDRNIIKKGIYILVFETDEVILFRKLVII